jgi:hypothetical protein
MKPAKTVLVALMMSTAITPFAVESAWAEAAKPTAKKQPPPAARTSDQTMKKSTPEPAAATEPGSQSAERWQRPDDARAIDQTKKSTPAPGSAATQPNAQPTIEQTGELRVPPPRGHEVEPEETTVVKTRSNVKNN